MHFLIKNSIHIYRTIKIIKSKAKKQGLNYHVIAIIFVVEIMWEI